MPSFKIPKLISLIEHNKTLTPHSKESYIKKLLYLANTIYHTDDLFDIISDPQHFFKTLKSMNYSKRTMKAYIDTIMHIIRHYDIIPKYLHSEYSEMASELGSLIKDDYENGIVNGDKLKGMMDIEQLVKVKNALPISIDRMILSCYLDIPPQRNNFRRVRICNNYDDFIYWSNIDGDKSNYIIIDDEVLYMFRYKGSSKKDPYEVRLTHQFIKELNDYMKWRNGIHKSTYLFLKQNGDIYSTDASFDTKVNETLKHVTGNPHINMTSFRHMAVSMIDFNNTTIAERKELAQQMGHSTMAQDLIYNWRPAMNK